MKDENYYELLKVDPRATVAEIVSAYHTARNAFSKDSLAVYSLFDSQETETVLKKLEEAYLTLTNVEKKRDYDRKLTLVEGTATPSTPAASTASAPSTQPTLTLVPNPTPVTASAPATNPVAEVAATPTSPVRGTWLRQMREERSMSLEDVSRVTKIPLRFLKAIENESAKDLPARVYLQGFVTNLTKVYKLDPVATTKAYLQHVDRDLLSKPTT